VLLVDSQIVQVDWFVQEQSLAFTMQPQCQTQWCWAATATSIAHYYDPASAWTQCSLVDAELRRNDCCSSPSSFRCNRPWTLDTALERVGQLAEATSGWLSFTGVRREIDAGRPLAVRIAWGGGSRGHFTVVRGYSAESEEVQIEDPFYGPSTYDYYEFRSRYRGGGSWSQSYKTQP
jgi:hypothetical protein